MEIESNGLCLVCSKNTFRHIDTSIREFSVWTKYCWVMVWVIAILECIYWAIANKSPGKRGAEIDWFLCKNIECDENMIFGKHTQHPLRPLRTMMLIASAIVEVLVLGNTPGVGSIWNVFLFWFPVGTWIGWYFVFCFSKRKPTEMIGNIGVMFREHNNAHVCHSLVYWINDDGDVWSFVFVSVCLTLNTYIQFVLFCICFAIQ